MFNSFSRHRIVKVAVGFVAGIACIVQTQTIVQAAFLNGADNFSLKGNRIANGTYTIRSLGTISGAAYIVKTQTIVQTAYQQRTTNSGRIPIIANGTYTIRSLGTIPGADYLDGRTGNGTVGLAPTYTRGFTGARWQISSRVVRQRTYYYTYYTIRSCGTTPGADYLDGRTGNGTVGLAPTYTGGFTGARWSITPTNESCAGPG
ncbi:hypothetical protein [Nostoc sp. WHI]|uniref:hypothetical protein n=1 Tax=Nostoc sp. WHI TaxID=2650611 RepID=UPI0018C5BBEC|nr:hypothetical protein [Nostoc sp. WHI]MBG1268939.1 hypothetical protein [Nostoc sp. WHI]